MKKKILVVVDMQEDFISPKGKLYIGRDTTGLVANIRKLVAKPWEACIYTMDTHAEGDCEFDTFPSHCIKGTKGWNLVDGVMVEGKPDQRTMIIWKKSYTGAYVIDELLSYNTEDYEIHFAGVCMHICVHDIIADLVNVCKEYRNMIPNIVVHKDCIADIDDEMADFAIGRLRDLYGVKFI